MVIDKEKDTDYKGSIRTLLGVDRTDDITLSNEDIDDVSILDMADMEVMGYLPAGLQSSFSGQLPYPDDNSQKRARLAAIYVMAALLCPSMPSRVEIEVKGIDSGWKKKAIDYSELAESLRGKAVALLEPLAEVIGLGDSDLFRIAPSKRAVKSRHEPR